MFRPQCKPSEEPVLSLYMAQETSLVSCIARQWHMPMCAPALEVGGVDAGWDVKGFRLQRRRPIAGGSNADAGVPCVHPVVLQTLM